MLNELYALAKSLEKCGLNPPTYHPSLKQNAKKDGFVLGIEDNGAVGFVEFCEAKKMGEVWRIESSSNGVSFPGFNLASPIWKPMGNAIEIVQKLLKLPKQNTQERLGLLEAICQHSVLAYSDSQKKQLQSNLREFPARLWQVYSDSISGFEAFSSLLSRLIKSMYSIDVFLQMVTDTSLRLCHEGRLGTILAVEQLLLGRWNKQKEEFTAQAIPVVCEVANRSDYQQVVVSPMMASFANTRLQERMPGKDFAASRVNTVESSGIDAFVGTEMVLQSTFPSPILPRLGKTILMSMSSESPCQTRYGLQDSDTFPVSKNVSEVMQNALLFLTRDEREGRTWHGVPNPKGKQDLLLSYLEDKPDSAALLASLFAESADLEELEEAQFENIAAKVCTALKGEVSDKTDAVIRVLVISSPDQGRKQLVLSESYQVEEIFRAAEDWQLASTNHPEIKVFLPPAKQQKARLAAPFPPFPAAMMACLNIQWTHAASSSQNIASCNLQQIYEVFLKQTERSRSTSGHLLSLALQSTSNLLLALGHRQHCNSQRDLSAKARTTALTAISSLSILLYKQGRRKEMFMNQAPFNIGRLLSCADQLHFIYCKEVRDNQIPPQLLGNALMNTALQRPASALALFAQRILPYQAWARTVQEGENVGLAKYFLKEIATVSQTLSQSSLPEILTDEDRAEMILGYLVSATSNNP